MGKVTHEKTEETRKSLEVRYAPKRHI